jgi:hypothetical protein
MEVIGVCGFGYSGSGAITDLLQEYDEVSYVDIKEFPLLYWPDGIEDLDYHINIGRSRYLSSDIAIKRFARLCNGKFGIGSGIYVSSKGKSKSILEEYVTNLTDAKWHGFWEGDCVLGDAKKNKLKYRIFMGIQKRYCKFLKKTLYIKPYNNMFFSYERKDFEVLTKKMLEELLRAAGFDFDKKVVLDQVFSADNLEKSFKYFNDPKAIVVFRDPRDTYILAKRFKMYECAWIPQHSVDDFIVFYKKMHANILSPKADKRILYIAFEDIVYNYENVVDTIEKFLSIKSHSRKGKFLDINISRNNTQLYQLFPEEQDNIKAIERELPEFLYSFEKCAMHGEGRDGVF